MMGVTPDEGKSASLKTVDHDFPFLYSKPSFLSISTYYITYIFADKTTFR